LMSVTLYTIILNKNSNICQFVKIFECINNAVVRHHEVEIAFSRLRLSTGTLVKVRKNF
jgi:hypothetical protein